VHKVVFSAFKLYYLQCIKVGLCSVHTVKLSAQRYVQCIKLHYERSLKKRLTTDKPKVIPGFPQTDQAH
jgi:hypothetical protein